MALPHSDQAGLHAEDDGVVPAPNNDLGTARRCPDGHEMTRGYALSTGDGNRVAYRTG